MRQLTDIEREYDPTTKQWRRELTREELLFLYELDGSIQGFGYDKDPRVIILQKSRKDANLLEHDQCLVFACEPNQIITTQEDFVRNAIAGIETKVYVGPLFKDIFKTFGHLEHIFTTFPEGRIIRSTIEIGGKTKKELEKEMVKQKIQVNNWTKSMMKSDDFTIAKKSESVDLIRLKVRDLNLTNPTTENIYKKAEELGLELCPPEVGPQYRLQYNDQPTGEYLYIGMKQITDSDDYPVVFKLNRDDEGLWLDSYWAQPTNEWNPERGFVFRLRK